MREFFKKLQKKPIAAKPGEINEVILDRFTFAHFLIGCVYAYFGLEFWTSLFLAIIWELIENPLKASFPSLFPRGTADSLRNLIGDIAAVMLGWCLVILLWIKP